MGQQSSSVCVCVVVRALQCVVVHSPRRRVVVVRGAVRSVGGTFWSVGGKPTGGDCTTVVRQQATVPPWADSSSDIWSDLPFILI